MDLNISVELYPAILYYSLLFFLTYYFLFIIPTEDSSILQRSERGYSLGGIMIALSVILFLGLRPIHFFFVDTVNYANIFEHIKGKSEGYFEEGDIGFRYIMLFLSQLGASTHFFLLFIEALYVGGLAYVTHKIFRKNAFIVLIAIFSTFFFYNYGVNTIRNGLACSMMLVGIYFHSEKRIFPALLFSILAVGLHISSALVAIAYIASCIHNKTSHYLFLWVICLLISIVIGRSLETMLQGIRILDNWRSVDYFSGKHVNLSLFSRVGYRWDFVLYSIPPIIWGGYWIVYKNFRESFFVSIFNVYVFTNSLWLLVNQNWLSDRIAGLSWFLQAFIFMYPTLKKKQVQHRKLLIGLTICLNLFFSIYYKVLRG